MAHTRNIPISLLATMLLGAVLAASAPASEPSSWLEIRSTHYTVITDAGEKKGKEVALRFEQMRAVFATLLMRDRLNEPVPLTILAFRNDKSYYQSAPLRQGQPIDVPGFFLPGEDQNFIVLNLFEEESWRAVAHDFAHLLLNYNYPPAAGWFDEGLAEYFSSIRWMTRSTRSAVTLNCVPPSSRTCRRTSGKVAILRSRSPSFWVARSGWRCPTCSP